MVHHSPSSEYTVCLQEMAIRMVIHRVDYCPPVAVLAHKAYWLAHMNFMPVIIFFASWPYPPTPATSSSRHGFLNTDKHMYTLCVQVMLGYNVMTVDTDTVPLADFYSRVKAYPASQYTMMSQAEDIYTVNGGFT